MGGEYFRGRQKKLIEVARAWARGGHEPLDDDDRAMLGDGADAVEQDSCTLIWPENKVAVDLFFQLTTQWYWYDGHRYGLIYSEVIALMNIFEITNKRDCIERLMVLEAAAMEVFND